MITGIVIAAGTSERFGEPKQLLDVGGKPLLQHAIDALAGSSVDEMVVVLGHHEPEIRRRIDLPANARIAVNGDYQRGQSTSLRTGLSSVDPATEAAVIVLGDQPGLTMRSIDVVIAAFRESHLPLARARFEGTPGHPVCVSHAAFGLFAALSGDTGARAVLEGSPDVLDVELGIPAPIDVDTPDDLAAVLAQLGAGRLGEDPVQ